MLLFGWVRSCLLSCFICTIMTVRNNRPVLKKLLPPEGAPVLGVILSLGDTQRFVVSRGWLFALCEKRLCVVSSSRQSHPREAGEG